MFLIINAKLIWRIKNRDNLILKSYLKSLKLDWIKWGR